MWPAAVVTLLAALPLSLAQTCPAGIPTACGPTQTCCPTFESLTGFGCCALPGAVCCPAGPETQTCCPAGHTCAPSGYGATCVPPAGGSGGNVTGTHVCPPGALLPPTASHLPSVITIGDSVSEGYQPVLTANLSQLAFIQHSPHSDGGGADDVEHGVACEENFLRTAQYEAAEWNIISYNFGLHDLLNTSSNYAMYEAALTNFTARLQRTRSKLLYISTTPQMQQQWFGNTAVTDLNAIAKRVTAAAGIPYADLYTHITAYCGALYTSCDLCDDESSGWPPGSPPGAHCGYHYTPKGYAYIVDFLAPIFKALL